MRIQKLQGIHTVQTTTSSIVTTQLSATHLYYYVSNNKIYFILRKKLNFLRYVTLFLTYTTIQVFFPSLFGHHHFIVCFISLYFREHYKYALKLIRGKLAIIFVYLAISIIFLCICLQEMCVYPIPIKRTRMKHAF